MKKLGNGYSIRLIITHLSIEIAFSLLNSVTFKFYVWIIGAKSLNRWLTKKPALNYNTYS